MPKKTRKMIWLHVPYLKQNQSFTCMWKLLVIKDIIELHGYLRFQLSALNKKWHGESLCHYHWLDMSWISQENNTNKILKPSDSIIAKHF